MNTNFKHMHCKACNKELDDSFDDDELCEDCFDAINEPLSEGEVLSIIDEIFNI